MFQFSLSVRFWQVLFLFAGRTHRQLGRCLRHYKGVVGGKSLYAEPFLYILDTSFVTNKVLHNTVLSIYRLSIEHRSHIPRYSTHETFTIYNFAYSSFHHELLLCLILHATYFDTIFIEEQLNYSHLNTCLLSFMLTYRPNQFYRELVFFVMSNKTSITIHIVTTEMIN